MPRSLRENSWCNGWYFRDNRGHSKPRCAEKGGEGRAVQRCCVCRAWNAVLPYPKPDVTFVGQWPRDDPRSSPQTVSRLRLLRTNPLLLSFSRRFASCATIRELDHSAARRCSLLLVLVYCKETFSFFVLFYFIYLFFYHLLFCIDENWMRVSRL